MNLVLNINTENFPLSQTSSQRKLFISRFYVFLKHSSCIIPKTSYLFFPPKKILLGAKMFAFCFSQGKENFSLFTMPTTKYIVFSLLWPVQAGLALSTCRIYQSFCDSSAGVCLAGNQITPSKWPLWCQCRHPGHYD